MTNIPVLDRPPKDANEPVLASPPGKKRWTFSWRYWRQVENFGLSESQPKWFVSLLDKLKDLSDKEIESFISDATEQSAWRYHQIDWNQKNIPIQRDELSWLDSCYLDNPDEYPILQFQVSQSLGRVVGFWDENSVFNIVLLDPLHNIQPAKSHSYKVNPCSPLSCEYSSLLYQFQTLKNRDLCGPECGYRTELQSFPSGSSYTNVVMHFISDSDMEELEAVVGNGYSHSDILMLGVQVSKE